MYAYCNTIKRFIVYTMDRQCCPKGVLQGSEGSFQVKDALEKTLRLQMRVTGYIQYRYQYCSTFQISILFFGIGNNTALRGSFQEVFPWDIIDSSKCTYLQPRCVVKVAKHWGNPIAVQNPSWRWEHLLCTWLHLFFSGISELNLPYPLFS